MNFFCKHFGHKFQPRYHYEESEGKLPENFWSPTLAFSEDAAIIIDSTKSKKKTYLHDVCVRCGEKLINSNDE